MKYHLLVLGCQMNLSDSERVKSVIEEMGFEYTNNENEATLLGIISCSVRQKPIDKVYNRIHIWNKSKNKRNLITFVSGCVLPDDKKKFLKLFDFVFSMSELSTFPKMLKEYGVASPASINQSTDINYTDSTEKTIEPKKKPIEINFHSLSVNQKFVNKKNARKSLLPNNEQISGLWNVKPQYDSTFEAFVPVQNGCDKFCTYCAVPYTRGREVSRPNAEIIAEVVNLMKQGYKSITLLGQNVNSYGIDNKNEISFAELLCKIGEEGEKLNNPSWIYFTSPHPRDMSNDVIDAVAKYKTFAKQIHFPLQSGDNKILVKMNRKHNLERYRESAKYIAEKIPQATLFTDIILGFTGETEEQFMNTMASFDEFKFNMAYIAMYSPRPGAQSFRWADDVDKEVKKDRFKRLTAKLSDISKEYNQSFIGTEMDVLARTIERKTEFISGHNEGKIIVRIMSKDTSLIGKMVRVKITEAIGFSMSGEIIKVK